MTTSRTQRNWTRRATRSQCHCFLWSLGFFRRGPDFDMALDSHGFVWHLLTFYIGSFPLTFHALSLHGERCSRPTSYIFLLRIIFQLGLSWTLTNFHHFVNLVWKRHCATRPSQLDSAAMTVQIGTIRRLHQELNATGHAGQLGASVIAFLIGPFGFLRRGPDFDMALDSHGFVWHLLTFYISNLTSEASLWHSMLCPFTASMARGTWGSWTKMLDDVSESKREQKLCIVHDVNWCHVDPNP